MALFMSEKQMDVTVRNQQTLYAGNPPKRVGFQRRVSAEFRKGGVPEWALRIAEDTFKMGGKPPGVPLNRWLCTYDSELDQLQHGWTDEERVLIEERLRAKGNVVEITRPALAAPWPNYDKLVVHGRRTEEKVAEQILAGIETTGVDIGQVIAYERENLNRPFVVGALMGLMDAQSGEDEAEPLIAA